MKPQDRLDRRDPGGQGGGLDEDDADRPSVDGHDMRPRERREGDVRRAAGMYNIHGVPSARGLG